MSNDQAVSADQLLAGVPCCPDLRHAIAERYAAIAYWPAVRSVVLLEVGAEPVTGLLARYCPFCGAALLRPLDDVRYDLLDELGLLPPDGVPVHLSDYLADQPGGQEFVTDGWWRERLLRDPTSLDVVLPELGSVLAIHDHVDDMYARVLVVGRAASAPAGDERILVVGRCLNGSWDEVALVASAWAYSQNRWPVVGSDHVSAALLARTRLWSNGDSSVPEQAGWEFLSPTDGAAAQQVLAPIDLTVQSEREIVLTLKERPVEWARSADR